VIGEPNAIIAQQPIVVLRMPQTDVAIDSPLPATVYAGSPTALFVAGRGGAPELTVDGAPVALRASGMPVPGAGRTGWWTVADLPARPAGTEIALAAGGRELARIGVEVLPAAAPAGRSIAICMATYEPDPELFARQIDSIREQTDTDWVCVISDDGSGPEAVAAMERVLGDDPRFRFDRAAERQVFYRNFERALTLAPPDATLIALSDQDDVWYPHKLATLRAALGADPLAYSEQRLVTPDGALVRESLWNGREPNHTDITSLLVAGGVTGAAMLMRREVADLAVPFPDTPGMDFHDHWIALVALALGDIVLVEEPLYDYVQHGAAVFGESKDIPQSRGERLRSAYFGGYLARVVFARTLLARLGDRIAPGKRRALERFADAEHAPFGATKLALRAASARDATLGSETELALGLLWRRFARAVRDTRTPDRWSFQQKRLRQWRWGA
jgi:hypothetical protein